MRSTVMFFDGAIVTLCGVGIYTSAFMMRKSRRAARGELSESSVVQSDRARVFGLPNAVLGLAYYVSLAAAIPMLGLPGVWLAAVTASLIAAIFSVFLAYSLLFATRMPCVYCWTSHVTNWLLPVLLIGGHPK